MRKINWEKLTKTIKTDKSGEAYKTEKADKK